MRLTVFRCLRPGGIFAISLTRNAIGMVYFDRVSEIFDTFIGLSRPGLNFGSTSHGTAIASGAPIRAPGPCQ